MMKPPKSIMTTFLALLFAGHVHLNSVSIHPERATGIVGQEAHINCEVEFGKNYEMNWDFNEEKLVYMYTNEEEWYPKGKSKYSVQRAGKNFTLIIKNLNLEDGGKYICQSFKSSATAFLLVLDTPSITLYPPKPIEGQAVEVTCEARFRGPREDLILPNHFPNLTMYLNGSSLNEMHTAETNNNVKEYHLITLTKKFTVHANMNTRQITCESGTAEPLTNISATTVMNVLYSVRNIYVTPKQEIFDVGDNITCIADSNPEAVYEWNKVQGGSIIFGNRLNITATMIGENNWECVARNVINGEWFEERMQAHFVAVDPSKSGNYKSPVTIVIILVFFVAAAFVNKIRKIYKKQSRPNIDPVVLESYRKTDYHQDKAKQGLVEKRSLQCGNLLFSVKNKQELDLHGKEIVSVLKEDGKLIVKNHPNILNVLIRKACDLIDSEYYEDIIKAVPRVGEDDPLKYLLNSMEDNENFKKLFKAQKKLLSVIQIISSHGDVQYRTECLRLITFKRTFSGNEYTFGSIWEKREYRFEWSEEYLSTLKDLLENGADPTWIHPEDLEKKRENRTNAQNAFFFYIFVNLWEKNDLHESLLQVLPLMLSWKCKDNELLQGTLLHHFVLPHWDYIATNRGSMPPDFFRQFKNILRKILRQDGTLLVQKNFLGRTPLQRFLIGIELEESIFEEVREIMQMLQSPQVLSSQDHRERTALHYLAHHFPVIRGEVTQSRRESFLELLKSFANESNVGCQDKYGETALHILARKFPDRISEDSREVYQDFVKHLATYDILEIKDILGRTALHFLADRFRFEIKEWKMETFVEVLKCLAVPRTICIKDKNRETAYGETSYGETALEMISRKWGNKVTEHYKDKFKEISDILSENN